MDAQPVIDPNQPVNWSRVRRFAWLLTATVFLAILFFWIYRPLLVPILVSAFLSYLISPVVDAAERRGWPRWLTTLALLTIVCSVIAFALIAVIPFLYTQSLSWLQQGPEAFRNWWATLLPQVTHVLERFGITEAQIVEQSTRKFNVITGVLTRFETGLGGIVDTSSRLVGGVFNTLLVPFLMFFMLKDEHRIFAAIKKILPVDQIAAMTHVARTINETLRSVLKGTVIVAFIDGALYAMGLSLLGVESAVAIGLVGGACRIVPYLDALVVTVLGLIATMSNFESWGQVVGVLGLVVAVQTIDGIIVTPRVIGEKVGLHPAFVVSTVLAFGKLFGFWGVLLAIPVTAVVKALMVSGLPWWFRSSWYSAEIAVGSSIAGSSLRARMSTAPPEILRHRRLERLSLRRPSPR
jgi:predicted PurR-regulated permease PerM